MRLQVIKFWSPSGGYQLRWAGTQADAKREVTRIKRECDGRMIETLSVDVPTDKAGLVDWLNENLNINNDG